MHCPRCRQEVEELACPPGVCWACVGADDLPLEDISGAAWAVLGVLLGAVALLGLAAWWR